MSFKNVNLSEWALKNQPLVKYFLILLFLAGIYSYMNLNQREDPNFTIKSMVITVSWPGATEQQMEDQVVDKIEKKLLELSTLNDTSVQIRPGSAIITVDLGDTVRGQAVADSWYQVRKKISDISSTLPPGVVGPFFNDEFGDTYSNIYAFQSNGYDYEELRRIIEDVKREVLTVDGIKKVDIIGTQNEEIAIDVSSSKLATLGVSIDQVLSAIKGQNSVNAAGSFVTKGDEIPIRVTGNFENLDQVRSLPIAVNGKIFRLGDVADVKRQFQDPPKSKVHYNGQTVLLMGIVPKDNADVVKTGILIENKYQQIKQKLPVGITPSVVSNQPGVVTKSVNEFVHSLVEAVVIVLIVSFISLGWRTGIVVAISIPLVLSVTFMIMMLMKIDLQRISLGALIIALGLLVDDAIIAVEMMVLKMEEGLDKFQAATFAYTSTAFPMLSGTLITVAGFLPVGLNDSTTGEYVYSLFAVVGISLVVSWFVAVIFTPYLGYHLLPADKYRQLAEAHHGDMFDKPFYRKFKNFLTVVVEYKRTVVLSTVGVFALSLVIFKLFVAQQFFPASDRPELLVDLWLPYSSSIYNTESQASRFEQQVLKESGVENVTTFIGVGAPRFVLTLDVQQENTNFAQLLIMTKGDEERDIISQHLQHILATQYPDIRGRVKRLELGPPVGYPIQFRVSGPDEKELIKISNNVESTLRAYKGVVDVNNNWGDDLKSMRLTVNQSKAQEIGVSSSDLEQQLNMLLSGTTTTSYLDKDETIPVVVKLDKNERDQVSNLSNLMIQTARGAFIPVGQIAKAAFITEPSLKYRRTRVPTITVRADVAEGVQGNDVTAKIYPKLKAYEATLPLGYHIEVGGSAESSGKAGKPIAKLYPVMALIIITLLMLQLNSFKRSMLVVATAPLGMIGVTMALIIFHAPYGFVAMLGVIALAGIIMRNSVILIDQIESDIDSGETPYEAIQMSVLRRFRPIMLTAAAAILGMIPLVRSVFWGPMAVAMMGGLFIATLLTLIFLPALYAWAFKISKPAN
ncbi:MAG: efflux RND transporter permease subunit [Proteobacteria bacterium]|nr:MAG: efflux RND transporter permease subunit [Pseudomonadota bacterium]